MPDLAIWQKAGVATGAAADVVAGLAAAVDAAVPIQAALDAASAAGGGVVTIPPGNWNVATTINVPSGVTLRGRNAGVRTLVNNQGRGSVLKAKAGTALDPLVRAQDVEGVVIRDLVLDGQDLATTVLTVGGFQCRVTDCEIKRGATYGLKITTATGGAHECIVRGSIISMNARGTGVLIESSDNVLDTCVVRGATTALVHIRRSGGNQVLNSHLYDYPTDPANVLIGVLIEGANSCQVMNNYIDQVGGGPSVKITPNLAPALAAYNHQINGNTMLCPGLVTNTQPMILLDALGQNNKLFGVQVHDNRGNTDDAVDVRWTAMLSTQVGAGNAFGISFIGNSATGAVKNFIGQRPNVMRGNYRATDYFEGTISPTENGGDANLAANAALTSFTINHGLDSAPRIATLTPANNSARLAGMPAVSKGNSQLTLTFATAPAAGTLAYTWTAEL